jgi:isopentenyl-diphosphate delta-isomerase
MVKAIILGASLCGIASPFLKPAVESADKVVEVIHALKREFTTAMFLLGVKSVKEMIGNEGLLLKS